MLEKEFTQVSTYHLTWLYSSIRSDRKTC